MSNNTDEEIQKKICDLLKKQPGIDRTKIAELLNLQLSEIETSVQKLVRNNLIIPIEEHGYTRYYLGPPQRNGKEQTTGETREKILTLITQNPGLHLSKIAELLTMSKPLAEYHLLRMEKEETIQVSKETGYKRYYITDEDIETTDKKILSLLRKDIPLKIVLFLANHKNAKHKDILQYLNIAPSTLSYHLNNDRLRTRRRRCCHVHLTNETPSGGGSWAVRESGLADYRDQDQDQDKSCRDPGWHPSDYHVHTRLRVLDQDRAKHCHRPQPKHAAVRDRSAVF